MEKIKLKAEEELDTAVLVPILVYMIDITYTT